MIPTPDLNSIICKLYDLHQSCKDEAFYDDLARGNLKHKFDYYLHYLLNIGVLVDASTEIMTPDPRLHRRDMQIRVSMRSAFGYANTTTVTFSYARDAIDPRCNPVNRRLEEVLFVVDNLQEGLKLAQQADLAVIYSVAPTASSQQRAEIHSIVCNRWRSAYNMFEVTCNHEHTVVAGLIQGALDIPKSLNFSEYAFHHTLRSKDEYISNFINPTHCPPRSAPSLGGSYFWSNGQPFVNACVGSMLSRGVIF